MSQLLARDLGANDQALVAELLKIMQEERQQRDAEAELKAKLFENRDERWPYRPHVSDYCGVSEDSGESLVHELKNRTGACPDWRPGAAVQRECHACAHVQRGAGPVRDVEVLREIALLAQNAAALGESAPDRSNNYVQLVGTRKAFEAAQAYYAGRIVGDPPEYLSTCAKFSTPGNAIPCVAQNPGGTCAAWTPAPGIAPEGKEQPSMMDALGDLPASTR